MDHKRDDSKAEKKARCLGKRISRNIVEDMRFEVECHDR